MRAVIQRVRETKLSVDGKLISEIPYGLAVYLAISIDDGEKNAELMAKKIGALRIFEDSMGKMNLSIRDVGGEALLISQFTLYGDCRHGNRPNFTQAARPEQAKPLYDLMIKLLEEQGIAVSTGIFGADMKIQQYNDGPVTIIFDC